MTFSEQSPGGDSSNIIDANFDSLKIRPSSTFVDQDHHRRDNRDGLIMTNSTEIRVDISPTRAVG